MGRIGDFDPSSQGPIEPPGSLEEQIDLYKEYIDEDEIELSRVEDQADALQKQIENLQRNLDWKRKEGKTLEGRISEYQSYILDINESIENIQKQIESYEAEIELLLEDSGNEDKVLALRTEIRELNNTL